MSILLFKPFTLIDQKWTSQVLEVSISNMTTKRPFLKKMFNDNSWFNNDKLLDSDS